MNEQQKRLARITTKFRVLSNEFQTLMMELEDIRKDGHEDYKNLIHFEPMSEMAKEQFRFVQQLDMAMEGCKVEKPLEKFVSVLEKILVKSLN